MMREGAIHIGARAIATDQPTYFIADIASNHDGSLERARALIHLCGQAGADAVKFQHFLAGGIVSDYGFEHFGGAIAHQAAWSKPVVEVYRQYELNREWTAELAATARAAGVDFLTTPYDLEAVGHVAKFVAAFKIGSGDIDWIELIEHVLDEGKPVLIAAGASSFEDVERAVNAALKRGGQTALMQCNTNYTGSVENFRYVNLRVLETFARHWPGMVLGLSDHTPGHATVLGAVALGARLVEKHFTDDNGREGPDHAFSMTPGSWSEMVKRTRELELSLGDGVKRVESNELESAIVQRRCLRLTRDVAASTRLRREDLECLRPAEHGSLAPHRLAETVGLAVARDLQRGEALRAEDLRSSLQESPDAELPRC